MVVVWNLRSERHGLRQEHQIHQVTEKKKAQEIAFGCFKPLWCLCFLYLAVLHSWPLLKPYINMPSESCESFQLSNCVIQASINAIKIEWVSCDRGQWKE